MEQVHHGTAHARGGRHTLIARAARCRVPLGWHDEHGRASTETGGYAIRPTLALLSAEAVGGNARDAVPAAVAVELAHNFSLLHDDVMDGDTTRRHRPTAWRVFGVSAAILADDAEAARRGLEVVDATCPLVTKVHTEACRFAARGDTVVLVGHAGHEEVVGTMGEAERNTVLVENIADAHQLRVPAGWTSCPALPAGALRSTSTRWPNRSPRRSTAREADLGVSSGNGKGQIFVRGKVIATVPESKIVETLVEQALKLAKGEPNEHR